MRTHIKPLTIPDASQVILEGRIVAFPTGTSYGLAVSALQGWALQRLRNLKQRPDDKTFTIFLDPNLWATYLDLTQLEIDFLQQYTNQPFTLLVSPKSSLKHLAQAGLIGLRQIDHELMRQLATAVEIPLTATSANRSGHKPCYTPDSLINTFTHSALPEADETTYDLSLAGYLDGGVLSPTPPTTILKLNNQSCEIIRQGEFTP